MVELNRVRMVVSGSVQGVGFRMFIHREAHELKLTGSVKNRPEGTVEIDAQGTLEQLDELFRRARRGPTRSRVTSISKEEQSPDSTLDRFTIIG